MAAEQTKFILNIFYVDISKFLTIETHSIIQFKNKGRVFKFS